MRDSMAAWRARGLMAIPVVLGILMSSSAGAATQPDLVAACVSRMHEETANKPLPAEFVDRGCGCTMERMSREMDLSGGDGDVLIRLLRGASVHASEIRDRRIMMVGAFLPMAFAEPDIQACIERPAPR